MPPNRVALPPARISAERSLEEGFDVILRGRRHLGTGRRQIDRNLGAHAELAGRVEAGPDGEAGPGRHDPRVLDLEVVEVGATTLKIVVDRVTGAVHHQVVD